MNFKDLQFTDEAIAKANLHFNYVNNALLNTILDILIEKHGLDSDKVFQKDFNRFLEDALDDLEEYSIKKDTKSGNEPKE